MDNSDFIKKAVKVVQGRRLKPGNVACHESDPITRELVRYEDNEQTAVLSWGGVTKRWPASEVFDPNDAKDVALQLLCRHMDLLKGDYGKN